LESNISSLIISAERGDGEAANALFAALYEDGLRGTSWRGRAVA
jgi:hypothetical protein